MSKVQLAGNASGTGVFTIASPNSNIDRTLTLPDNTGTLLTSGNPISGTTGTFSGLIQANGGGIQFPATQVASGNANTLDDYEEGTWTPFLQSINGDQSVTLPTASYVKIGRFVTINVNAYNTPVTAISAANHLFIRGLPFSANAIEPGPIYIGSIMSQFPNQPVSVIDFGGFGVPLYAPATAVDWTPFTRNTWGGATNMSLRFSFSYTSVS